MRQQKQDHLDNAYSALYTAFVKAEEQFNISGRVCSQKAILLVTDGNNFHTATALALRMEKGKEELVNKTLNAAEKLKTKFGTDIFLVGIGSNFEEGENRNYIASTFDRAAMLPLQNIFAVKQHDQLLKLSRNLNNVYLQTAEPTRPTEPFDHRKFLLDMGYRRSYWSTVAFPFAVFV